MPQPSNLGLGLCSLTQTQTLTLTLILNREENLTVDPVFFTILLQCTLLGYLAETLKIKSLSNKVFLFL